MKPKPETASVLTYKFIHMLKLIISLIFLNGCAYINRSAIRDVDSIAIASVYMNSSLIDFSKHDEKDTDGKKSKKSSQNYLDEFNSHPELRKQIINHAYDRLSKRLTETTEWHIVPFKETPGFFKYEECKILEGSRTSKTVSNKTPYLPYELFIGFDLFSKKNKLHRKACVKSMGRIASDLGVDAVLVVFLQFGFSYDKSILEAMLNSIIPDDPLVKPATQISYLMINSNGKIILKNWQGKVYHYGKSINFLPITLTASKYSELHPIAGYFYETVDKAIEGLMKKIEK